MSDWPRIFDVFFNGRSADGDPKKQAPPVTIRELIKRGESHVLVDGFLYRVVVTKAKLAKE